MSEGPTRLTVRGGRDQFDWNNVKDDKHYHNYLGHSLKAPVGRWQRNKDLEWFNKAGVTDEEKQAARLEEIRKIKEAEEEAVAAAMGITLPPREERQAVVEAAPASKKTEHRVKDGESREERRHREHRRRSRSRSRSRNRRHVRRGDEHRESRRHRSDRSRSRQRSRDRRRQRSGSRERSRDRSRRHYRSRDESRETHHRR